MNTKFQSVGLQEFIPGVWYEMRDGRNPECLTFWQKRVIDGDPFCKLMGVSFSRDTVLGQVEQRYLLAPVHSFDRTPYPICRKASITWAEYCATAQEFHVFSK
jgi:hypothetical protein